MTYNEITHAYERLAIDHEEAAKKWQVAAGNEALDPESQLIVEEELRETQRCRRVAAMARARAHERRARAQRQT